MQGTDMYTTLREANQARHAEWTKNEYISPSFRGNEMAGEVGEACNILKKLEREQRGFVGSRATMEQLADELADVVICADLCAMDFGIDLMAAVARKFNKTSIKYGLNTRLKHA
jgi:NTP pyrophosphatase (non-canonical NTP hydrolase)